MTRSAILGIVFLGLILAGFSILSGWQIPAPVVEINKVISNDDLPK
jgi:hypothetical protein